MCSMSSCMTALFSFMSHSMAQIAVNRRHHNNKCFYCKASQYAALGHHHPVSCDQYMYEHPTSIKQHAWAGQHNLVTVRQFNVQQVQSQHTAARENLVTLNLLGIVDTTSPTCRRSAGGHKSCVRLLQPPAYSSTLHNCLLTQDGCLASVV